MAKIASALERVIKNEGVYSFDPHDPGGETVYGISRKIHPNWEGWPLVDALKPRVGVINPSELETNHDLAVMVARFYKATFWDTFSGDAFADQDLAVDVFDCAVNLGLSVAVANLQRALNVCNQNGKSWPDITPDGVVGPQTLAAVFAQMKTRPYNVVRQVFNILRGYDYVELMEKNHDKERYIGWFSRCLFITG